MNTIDTRFLPKKKAEFLREQYEKISKINQPLGLSRYKNVLIVPLGYVEDACNNPKKNRIVDDLDLCADIKDATSISEVEDSRVMYCGYLHHNAWGHFITNTLARMWPIVNDNQLVDKFVFLSKEGINAEDIKGNFAEILRLLGVNGRIEVLSEPKAYREVIVGDLSYMIDYKAYPEYVSLIGLIRKRALEASAHNDCNDKPVFFTRSALNNAQKRDIGIDLIDEFYRTNGFDVAYPEKMSITELIQRLECAPIAVFISGSGAHNSIFSPPGKEIHIIERAAICNIFQPAIEEAFSHKVVHIQASHSLLPVAYGSGPFLYAATSWLQHYASEYGYHLPPINTNKAKRNFKAYLKQREKMYKYRWWLDNWASNQLEIFLEAYTEALETYAEYVGGSESIYVSPLKQSVKRILSNHNKLK